MKRRDRNRPAKFALLPPPAAPAEPGFKSSRKADAAIVIALAALLSLGAFSYFKVERTLTNLDSKNSLENADDSKIRQYTQKLDALQNSMSVFIADSLETQLKILETKIKDGSIGPDEIKTFKELKAELKLLENSTSGRDGNVIDMSKLDHPRLQALAGAQPQSQSQLILNQMIQLKHLLYVSIASCGLVGVMVGGYWLQKNQKLRYAQLGLRGNVPLLEASESTLER
jgi:hypothetical protein